MIVVNSTEPEGALYVETKNLDGESNLKLKSVAKELIRRFEHESGYSDLTGITLNVEDPNNRIYKFDGNFCMQAQFDQSNLKKVREVPLSNENVVLRGMSLRNTEHVIGIVVYTGHDSKI